MISKWDNIQHFNKKENWGNPDKINPFLLLVMDIIRDRCGMKIKIHCGYERTGHATKSQHYKGNACDWHFDTDISFRKQYFILDNVLETTFIGDVKLGDLIGLGVYPNWNNQGFHSDCRGYRARWMQDTDGEYKQIRIAAL